MNDRLERVAPLWTALIVLGLYAAFPSLRYNFDGVACAIAVELGDLKHLAHGNHLLYGIVAWGFHRLLGALGAATSALAAMQLLGALTGAAGAGLFQRALARAGFSRGVATACAAGLALSHGYWLWSLEVQVYGLGALLLTLLLGEAIATRPRPYALAAFHGLAMLAHGANALAAPAVLYALRRAEPEPGPRRRDCARYLLAAAAVVVAGYLAAAAWLVRPASLAELRLWLLGSAALGEGRSLLWHGAGPLGGLRDWLRLCGETVCWARWLGLPLWAAGLWAIPGASGRRRTLAAFAWLWLGGYALLFTQWEPFTLVYRVSDLLPLWVLGAVAAESLLARLGARGAALGLAFVAALGGSNFQLRILPGSRPEINPALLEARWIRERTPPEAWLAAENEEEVYYPYFAHRRTINLRYYRGRREQLAERILDCLSAGQPVFATGRRLRSELLPEHLGLRAVDRSGELALYEIVSVAQ